MGKPYFIYTVTWGDTFSGISRRYNLSIDELLRFNIVNNNQIENINKIYVGKTEIYIPKITQNEIYKTTKESQLSDVLIEMNKTNPVSMTDLLCSNWRLREIFNGPATTIPASFELYIPNTGEEAIIKDGFSQSSPIMYNVENYPKYQNGTFPCSHGQTLEGLVKLYGGKKNEWIDLNQDIFNKFGWDGKIVIEEGKTIAIDFPFEACFIRETIDFDKRNEYDIELFNREKLAIKLPEGQLNRDRSPVAGNTQNSSTTIETQEPVVTVDKKTDFAEIYQNLPPIPKLTYVNPDTLGFVDGSSHQKVIEDEMYPEYMVVREEYDKFHSNVRRYHHNLFKSVTYDYLPMITTALKFEEEYTVYKGMYYTKAFFGLKHNIYLRHNHTYYFGDIGEGIPGVGMGEFRFSAKYSPYAEAAFVKLIEIAHARNELNPYSENYKARKAIYESHEAVLSLINAFKSSKTLAEFIKAIGSDIFLQLEAAMQDPNGHRAIKYIKMQELPSMYKSIQAVLDYAIEKNVIDSYDDKPYVLSTIAFLAHHYKSAFVSSAKECIDNLSQDNEKLTFDVFRAMVFEPFMESKGYTNFQELLNPIRNAARRKAQQEFVVENGDVYYVLNHQDVSKNIVFPGYSPNQTYVPRDGRGYLKLKIKAFTDKLGIDQDFADNIMNTMLADFDKLKNPVRGMKLGTSIKNEKGVIPLLNAKFVDDFSIDKNGKVVFD